MSTPSEAAPSYPAHLEADVVLADGGTAHLRPITPADADALQRFHMAQSPESVYLRFFAPYPRLSEADLRRFTNVDSVDRVALVATVGDEIIAVGRYDRTDPRTAEVAFNVSDAHQGRGLGSVLLEHLAAAAREHGVHRFVAEVLPQNRRMLGVFRDAGYEVRHAFEDGVVSLSFDIDPTERSLAVMESREHRAEFRSVAALLAPRSVVLVGASRRENTVGHRLLRDVLAGDFAGKLYVVHPEADAVLGVPAYRTIGDVPTPVDLAVIAVPAESVLDVVHQCAAAEVRGLVVVSGGFAETGEEGLERQRALVRVARANGMRVVGPNSWGVVNTDPDVRLNVGLQRSLPAAGRVGLFCQSGAVSVAVLENAERRALGVSTFVSAGNRADVSGNDCMQYWEEDPRTSVVGLYLESTGNPRKFSRIARRLSRTKPVVVVRSGTSGFGVAPGHAVRESLAPAEAFDAMLRQSGCIRVGTLTELLDVAELLVGQPLPAGPRVAVVANSEALGALVADACQGSDLEVPHGPASVPITAEAGEFLRTLTDAVASPDVDAVVAAFVPPVGSRSEDVAAGLAEAGRAARAAGRPIVACLLGMPAARGRLVGPDAVPVYPTPEEAVRALASVTRYARWRHRDFGPRVDPPGRDPARARRLVTAALESSPDGVELSAETAAALLACYGVRLWPALPVTGPDDAVRGAQLLGYPVALKTTAPHLRHRADLGGVRLDIAGPDELAEDVVDMTRRLAPLGGSDLVLQAMAPTGVACVVRSVEDPLFGPVVSFGVGGDATELLGDYAHRIPPLTTGDVHDIVRSVRAAPKLFGHRGARPVDVAALEDVVARISCLADDLPEVAELELNPVVVGEQGAHVLGAVIRLSNGEVRTDTVRRELSASS